MHSSKSCIECSKLRSLDASSYIYPVSVLSSRHPKPLLGLRTVGHWFRRFLYVPLHSCPNGLVVRVFLSPKPAHLRMVRINRNPNLILVIDPGRGKWDDLKVLAETVSRVKRTANKLLALQNPLSSCPAYAELAP
jgi:hypothetical protein